ncbi:MAG TPA: hypothetical protein VGR70_18025 [Stellaceae bacterium]|nr:hypothetical protein [Stellaceae bacterium]
MFHIKNGQPGGAVDAEAGTAKQQKSPLISRCFLADISLFRRCYFTVF